MQEKDMSGVVRKGRHPAGKRPVIVVADSSDSEKYEFGDTETEV